MFEQSGGYFLRKKKTKATKHENPTRSKEQTKGNTVKQGMKCNNCKQQDHLKTCNTKKRSL